VDNGSKSVVADNFEIKNWNNNVFKDIFLYKKILDRPSMPRNFRQGVLDGERKVHPTEHRGTRKKEDISLHIRFVKDGDKNTRLFHQSRMKNTSVNRVIMLKNNQ
jgi:hypothetical protein